MGGWGSGSTGNGVGEESILYAPSLNQHTTTRSAPLETAAPWPIQHHLWCGVRALLQHTGHKNFIMGV